MIDSVQPPLGQEQDATGTKYGLTCPALTNRPPEDPSPVSSPNGQTSLSVEPSLVPQETLTAPIPRRWFGTFCWPMKTIKDLWETIKYLWTLECEICWTIWVNICRLVPGTKQFVQNCNKRIQLRVNRQVSRLEGVLSLSGNLELVQSGYRKALYRLEEIAEWRNKLTAVLPVATVAVFAYVVLGTSPVKNLDNTIPWITQWIPKDFTLQQLILMLIYGGLPGVLVFFISVRCAIQVLEALYDKFINTPSLTFLCYVFPLATGAAVGAGLYRLVSTDWPGVWTNLDYILVSGLGAITVLWFLWAVLILLLGYVTLCILRSCTYAMRVIVAGSL